MTPGPGTCCSDPEELCSVCMAIVAGGAMTHSLVPPTPGPLVVAGELGVDLGRMIVGGILVGLVGMTGAFAYARWYNRNHPIELKDTSDQKENKFLRLAETPDEQLPGLFASLSPILIPVLLIAGKSIVLQFAPTGGDGINGMIWDSLMILGDKNLALTLGALLALRQLLKSKLQEKPELAESVKSSLQSAGVIILITGMGEHSEEFFSRLHLVSRFPHLSAVKTLDHWPSWSLPILRPQ